MHARAAVFDLYGDHLAERGGAAPIAAVVRLLAPVGIAAPAVRTAVSRMVGQGWLEPVSLPAGRGYAATGQARRRLSDAGARIYGRDRPAWDGTWQLALVGSPPGRAARVRLRADLGFLGFAQLAPDVWVSPRPSAELRDVVDRAGGSVTTAVLADLDPPLAAQAAWDLAALGASYDAWLAGVDALVRDRADGPADPDEADFAARFHLVHEWRKFLFSDPGLPPALLPADWPGPAAAAAFAAHAERLRPGADRFVARCLGSD